jgi:GT2 family glycosyltransferase
MYRVDAIVPCYNYGRYLRDCVESVTSQAGVDVRVLIIDDASTDNTCEVGARLASEDARVSYRRHPENLKHIATYNEGLAWAKHDYTLLLSADDMLLPGALFRATRLMEVNPQIGFVFGRNVRLTDGEPIDRTPVTSSEFNARIWNGLAWLRFVCRERSTFIDSPEVLVRTRMYKDLGGYRPELPHTADVEMWLRLAAHGDVGEIDANQAYYRIHQNNMNKSLAPSAVQSLEHWQAAYEAFFAHSGCRLPDEAQFRGWAADSIGRMALSAAFTSKYRRDSEICRKLIDLARRASPALESAPGRFAAGLASGRIRQPWATRKIFGAPVYLFRRVIVHGWQGIRLTLSADPLGAAFEAGRFCGHATLILKAWLNKLSRSSTQEINSDCQRVRVSADRVGSQ